MSFEDTRRWFKRYPTMRKAAVTTFPNWNVGWRRQGRLRIERHNYALYDDKHRMWTEFGELDEQRIFHTITNISYNEPNTMYSMYEVKKDYIDLVIYKCFPGSKAYAK